MGNSRGQLFLAPIQPAGSPEQEVESSFLGRENLGRRNKLKPVKNVHGRMPMPEAIWQGAMARHELALWMASLANRLDRVENNGVGRKGNIQG
jgi:hypothetical protein